MRRLWCHGKVDSMARPMRRCEAVGVENETIVFLGSDQEALTQNWDEIIDLEGRQVLPGFSDTHMHLLHYVLFQKNLALFGVDSIESIVRMGRERIAQNHPAASPLKSPSACCGCAPTSPPATPPWWSG